MGRAPKDIFEYYSKGITVFFGNAETIFALQFLLRFHS